MMQQRRRRAPFPNVTPGYEYLDSVGTSSYNALYVTASGQLTKVLTLSASYVWSKVLDEASWKMPSLTIRRILDLTESCNF